MDCYLRIVPAHGVVPFLGMLLLVCIVCWWYVSYRHSRCDKFIGLGSGLVIDLQIYIAQSSRSEQVKAAIFDSTLILRDKLIVWMEYYTSFIKLLTSDGN